VYRAPYQPAVDAGVPAAMSAFNADWREYNAGGETKVRQVRDFLFGF
jgi:hypothetical protein